MAHRPLAAALITALALLGAVPSSSLAQTDSAQTQPSVGVNVDFPGGTMEAYVEALRASSASPINVIFRNEAASLPVPKVKLRNVSVGTALEVAVPQRGAWVEMNDDGSMTEYVRGIDMIDAHSPTVPEGYRPEPAFVINASQRVRDRGGIHGARGAKPTRIEIFSLGGAAEGPAQTRDLLHAVDLALDLDQSPQKAEIKLHEDTMLLIARGTDAQIDAVNDVILRMQDNKANRLRESQKRALQISPLRARLIERRADVEELEIKRDLLAQDLIETNRLVEQEMIPPSALREADGELRITSSRLEGARARLQAVSDEFAALMGEGDARSEVETRTYTTPDVRAHARILDILGAIDSISGHIRSVESGKDGSATSIEVHADEEGHRVVSRIVAAMSKGP